MRPLPDPSGLRARTSLRWRAAAARARANAWQVLEATVAATLAWVVATAVFHHEVAFFAPAAAIITIGVTRGRRARRAIDVVVGVAVGVLVADLLASALRPHTTLAVLVITGLSLLVATVLDGGAIVSVQAAVSGVYVAVVTPAGSGLVPSRFVDALIGGGIALAVNQLPLPGTLDGRLLREVTPVFDRIAAALEGAATALREHDPDAAEGALGLARSLDGAVTTFRDAADAAVEVARLDPLRRRKITTLRAYEQAGRQLDLAARNVRVLSRAAVFLTRAPRPAPTALADAVVALAGSVRALGHVLSSAGEDGEVARLAEGALSAVRTAARALDETRAVPVVMIVGQIRATAVDLMRGAGMDFVDVLNAADEALGEHNVVG